MEVLPKLILLAIGLAFVLTATRPDATNVRKHRRQGADRHGRWQFAYRATNLFPAGPVYSGSDYIGDDRNPKLDVVGRPYFCFVDVLDNCNGAG